MAIVKKPGGMMSFFKNIAKMITAVSKANNATGSRGSSNSFSFIDEGKEPARDEKGRIVVIFSAGSQFEFDVNLFSYEDTQRELLGKPNEDFESRNVRVRLLLNPSGEGTQVIDIETTKGNKVGRFSKEDIQTPLQILNQLNGFLGSVDARLVGEFAFDVSAQVEGSWEYVEDDEDSPKPYWEPSLDRLTIRLKDPITFDIKSA